MKKFLWLLLLVPTALLAQTQTNPITQINWPLSTGNGVPTQYCPTESTGHVISGSTSIILTNMIGVIPNQIVIGAGIPAGTTVRGVNYQAGVVTLSQAATSSSSAVVLNFYSYGMPYTDLVGGVQYICTENGWNSSTGGAVTQVTAVDPVQSTGGAAPIISLPEAGNSYDGYLSHTDWAIFNSKQSALGFIPYNATNPAGYISGITSGNVVAALGFTPYNATNPSNYITASSLSPYALTSSLNTGAYAVIANYLTAAATASTYQPLLGFTPYNATNPAGYITSAAAASTYQPVGNYLTALTGDCTATGPGAIAITCTKSGGTAFGTGAFATIANYLTIATAASTYEPLLGNPSTNGYLLSSTSAGVRSWVAPYTLPGAVVQTNQVNTYGAYLQDFSGAPQVKHPVAAGYASAANGEIGYDTTNLNWHGWDNGADWLIGMLPKTGVTTGHCVEFILSGSTWSLADAGGACTTGGGGGTVNSGTAWSPAFYSATGTAVGGTTPFTGLEYWLGSAAPAAATSAQVQGVIGAGVYDVSGAAAARQANLSILPGTYVDGNMCTYMASGTLLNCNTAIPSGGTPGGSQAMTQFNNNGAFGAYIPVHRNAMTLTDMVGSVNSTVGTISGGSLSGTGTVLLVSFNKSCTGSTVTGNITSSGSWTSSTFVVTNSGNGCIAPPTTATCTSGTATCSGTVTFGSGTTVLGPTEDSSTDNYAIFNNFFAGFPGEILDLPDSGLGKCWMVRSPILIQSTGGGIQGSNAASGGLCTDVQGMNVLNPSKVSTYPSNISIKHLYVDYIGSTASGAAFTSTITGSAVTAFAVSNGGTNYAATPGIHVLGCDNVQTLATFTTGGVISTLSPASTTGPGTVASAASTGRCIPTTQTWVANAAYQKYHSIVVNVSGTNYVYTETAAAGNAGSGTPSWNTTLSSNTSDSGLVWNNDGVYGAVSVAGGSDGDSTGQSTVGYGIFAGTIGTGYSGSALSIEDVKISGFGGGIYDVGFGVAKIHDVFVTGSQDGNEYCFVKTGNSGNSMDVSGFTCVGSYGWSVFIDQGNYGTYTFGDLGGNVFQKGVQANCWGCNLELRDVEQIQMPLLIADGDVNVTGYNFLPAAPYIGSSILNIGQKLHLNFDTIQVGSSDCGIPFVTNGIGSTTASGSPWGAGGIPTSCVGSSEQVDAHGVVSVIGPLVTIYSSYSPTLNSAAMNNTFVWVNPSSMSGTTKLLLTALVGATPTTIDLWSYLNNTAPALVGTNFTSIPNSALVPSVSITRITFGNSATAGNAVPTGTTPSFTAPFAGTIISATLTGTLSAGTCSAVIDVWKTNAAIPTVSNTITASDLPTLSGAKYYQDTTLTGWSTGKTISKNDVLMANVNSATCDNWNLVLAVQQ